MYLALYRQYRPKTFDEIVGQNTVIQTLVNQIKMDKISHAYLFTGSRGTGKTSTAKIFARAINCLSPVNGSPCGKCRVCQGLGENNMDILEIDAASNNGVDEIRDLREKVKYPPVVGKYKVYIIDEVHMLSPSAFNALLKTLEEPPEFTVFILATTEIHKIPATILSRCLRFDFGLIPLSDLENQLRTILTKEGVKFDERSINTIARAGEGSDRDMLSIADRCISFAGNELTNEKVVSVLGISERETLISITENIFKKNIGETLVELDSILSKGIRPLVLANDMISYFRDLLMINALGEKSRSVVVVKDDVYEKMKSQATEENYGKIIMAIEILSEIEQELRYSVSPRIVLETALVKIESKVSLEERVDKIEEFIKTKFPRD